MSGGGATVAAQAAAAAGVIVVLVLPFSRGRLEATLVGHVLVQMPLLVLAGSLFGSALAARLDRLMEQWNRFGIVGFTFAIFTMLFWMVPRSVDSAIAHTGYEVFKFVSLPCAGAALALSFPRTLPLLAGALKANFVSMLGVLAWLYMAAPVRLCNSYLGSDQKMLGAGMALLAGSFAIYWGLGLLFGPQKRQSTIAFASGAAAAAQASERRPGRRFARQKNRVSDGMAVLLAGWEWWLKRGSASRLQAGKRPCRK